jgi:hypothetical protein
MSARSIAQDEPLTRAEIQQVIDTLRRPAWVDEVEIVDERGLVCVEHDPTGWYIDRDPKDGGIQVTVTFLTNRRAEVDYGRYVDERNLYGDDEDATS